MDNYNAKDVAFRRLQALLGALGGLEVHDTAAAASAAPSAAAATTATSTRMPHELYDNEPGRNPALRVNKDMPFNAEPLPKDLVRAGWITPDELFLSRNHGPIPLYKDEDAFSVVVSGLVRAPLTLTMDDIRTFPKIEVPVTIECAGNRRNEFSRTGRQVKGVGWEAGALSTGLWGGARLSDVLARAGIATFTASHVAFEGDDYCHEEQCGRNFYFKYGASIPLHKALDPLGEVVLAYEMNGKVLSRDRGFPLRVVVPGHIGARSVKWLRSIIVMDKEPEYFHQLRDYKLFPNTVDWNNVEKLWSVTPSLQEISVQSAICDPEEGATIGREYTFRGYALSGGGRRINRVDLSFDNGATWVSATLHRNQDFGDVPRHYAWTLWSYEARNVPSPCLVICRAWDISGNTQPEEARNIWNLRGVMNNCWFRVNVNNRVASSP